MHSVRLANSRLETIKHLFGNEMKLRRSVKENISSWSIPANYIFKSQRGHILIVWEEVAN